MTQNIFARLDLADISRLKHSAREAQKLESKWDQKIKEYLREYAKKFAKAKMDGERPPKFDLETLLEEHYFDVSFRAFGIAREEDELERRIRKLAKPPVIRVPKSLKDLRKLYDEWRKGRYTPTRPKKIAERITKQYLKQINSAWEKYSKDFRSGEEFTQKEVIQEIQRAAAIPAARAQTTVRTETTNFYNTVRREYYDQSPDVTHYLFMAVRDSATTPWCSPKTTDGKRGRHGLVYKKGDPLLEKESPACHWNCRSEILPLNPLIPSHLRLIQDASIQRRNVTCYPLPPGWESRAA